MLAAQYSEISSDFSGVTVVQTAKPSPAPGMCLVKIHAAAVNPVDCKVLGGHLVGAGWALPLPFTLGYDFAGVVEALDPVDERGPFIVGDKVFGVNWGNHKHDDDGPGPVGGAFAEYILMPISKISKIPPGVSYEQAAAVALVGTTAHQVLNDVARITEGTRILILGGPTSVGHLAIQLAKAKGAWVATTCSSRNLSFLSQFGADLVINYREENWYENAAVKGVDVVIDIIGETGTFSKAVEHGIVKSDGVFVSISSGEAGFNPDGHPPLRFAAMFCLANDPAVQDELAAGIASGALKLAIDQTFPFTTEGVRDLLQRVDSGAAIGKSILKIV